MNRSVVSTLALAALAGAGSRAAASNPPETARVKEQEVVTMSPFDVSASSSVGRYSSLESTSAGRVRTDIMDSSQSISVLTEEMVEDIAPGRLVDVAKYVAGVTESTLPTSWERTNMRGFQSEGRTVDGITYGVFGTYGYQNIDPALFERIEIVKGPNFILAPQPTSPGGTINNVTKKPQFRDFGLISARWGQFDANSGFLDVNRVLAGKLAVRVVGSERKWDNWWKGSRLHSTTLMPGLAYRISQHAQVTVQYIYTNWKASNYFGLPIDPRSGSTTPARILAGVPHDLDIYPDDLFRATRQHEFKLFFTAGLPKGIQMRLAAAYLTNTQHQTFLSSGGKTGDGGSIDPLTGFWNSGLLYQQVEPYAPSPLTTPQGRIFRRAGSELVGDPRQLNLQNDYAYILDPGFLRSTTVAGFAYRHTRNASRNSPLTAPEFNIDDYKDAAWSLSRLGTLVSTDTRFRQVYLSENLALLQNRLILNVAESWEFYHPSGRRQQMGSYGAVIKPPGEAVSLYSVYNATSVDATAARPSDAQQMEFGARLKVWGTGLYLTVSHFDITQDNVAVTNPGNTAVPRPDPLLPPLYSDRKARGWEYELRANPIRNLSIIGSYTHFKNRDPNNVRIWGVAEKSGGVLASYSFDQKNAPVLDGVRVAVGVNYLGNRPGDPPPTSFTVASRPAHLIPTQPTFYLDARTLTNLTLSYDSKQSWGVQVNVDNLFDKEYIQSSVSRYAVFPGTPRNLRVSARYKF